jgi:hypothetical protein
LPRDGILLSLIHLHDYAMSKAGKFIPGGGRKTSPMGPVRSSPSGGDEPPKKGRMITKGGLTRPVPKSRRLPILIMSSFVCCLLVSFAWYQFGVLPARKQAALDQQRAAETQKQLQATLDAEKKREAEEAAQKTAPGIVIVDSKPPANRRPRPSPTFPRARRAS